MKYRLQVVCAPAVALGFELAGLPTSSVVTPAEAERCILRLLDDPDLGVILLEEQWHGVLSKETRRELTRRSLPVVLPFPGPSWEPRRPGPDSYILELLRQAIGYRVRLQ